VSVEGRHERDAEESTFAVDANRHVAEVRVNDIGATGVNGPECLRMLAE
jgi:hypothetical protein